MNRLPCVIAILIAWAHCAQAAMTNRIHSFGVDFYFDANVEWGTFVTTNNIWVVPGAASLTNMTPAASGATNGWEINPQYGSQQGWATNIANYNAALRIPMPLNITSNCTLVKVIGTGATAQNTTAIRRSVALTFLTSAPSNPEKTFRPPYIGHAKPLYTLDDFKTNRIPSYSFAAIPSKQTLSNTVFKFSGGLMMDHMNGSGVSARQIRASSPKDGVTFQDYNPENNVFVFASIASLMSDNTDAEKQQAAIYLGQWFLDRAFIIEAGYRGPGTGHNPGHRVPATLGAVLFDLTNVLATCAAATNFHEDEFIIWSDVAGRALWGQRDASEEYQYWNYYENAGGSRSHKDPYGFVDGGAKTFVTGTTTNSRSDYLTITAQTLKSQVLIGLLWTNVQAGFGSNSWFLSRTFVERWVTNGMWFAPDPVAPFTGNEADYGTLYGPDGMGGYIAGAGRFTNYHGTSVDGGASGSQFIRELWNEYVSTDPPAPVAPGVPAVVAPGRTKKIGGGF